MRRVATGVAPLPARLHMRGMPVAFRPALFALLALLASCSNPRDDGEIDVSIIGDRPRLADPDHVSLSRSNAVLASATAMGLVALDGNGQVEPALAEKTFKLSDVFTALVKPALHTYTDSSLQVLSKNGFCRGSSKNCTWTAASSGAAPPSRRRLTPSSLSKVMVKR